MAGITHGGTLPDSSDKSDFYSLIDTSTIDLTTGTAIGTSSAAAGAFTTLTATGATTINDDGANSTCLYVDNDGTGEGIKISQDGVLSGAHALQVYSNAIQTSGYLLHINVDNAGNTAPAAVIDNDGTGDGLHIVQDGVLASTKHGLYIASSAATTAADAALVKLTQDSASAT